MANYRKLSNQAEAEIEALRSKGVTLSDSDIVAINALCWEIETPSRRVSLAKGKPIKCGNVWLWPLTIHGAKWLEDVGFKMSCAEIAVPYAMANRDKELYTVEETEIESWFKSLRCTRDELMIATACILNETEKDDLPPSRDEGVTISQLAQMMVDAHGGSFEMWERQCSIQYILDFIDTTSKQDEAEKKHTRIEKQTLILFRFTQSLLRKSQHG